MTNQEWLFVLMTCLGITGWAVASYMQHKLHKLQSVVRNMQKNCIY